jgi:hypothetical protein
VGGREPQGRCGDQGEEDGCMGFHRLIQSFPQFYI